MQQRTHHSASFGLRPPWLIHGIISIGLLLAVASAPLAAHAQSAPTGQIVSCASPCTTYRPIVPIVRIIFAYPDFYPQLTASEATAHPGDTVIFTVVAGNSGGDVGNNGPVLFHFQSAGGSSVRGVQAGGTWSCTWTPADVTCKVSVPGGSQTSMAVTTNIGPVSGTLNFASTINVSGLVPESNYNNDTVVFQLPV